MINTRHSVNLAPAAAQIKPMHLVEFFPLMNDRLQIGLEGNRFSAKIYPRDKRQH